MSRNIVIYSGGIDSTALVYLQGCKSTKENPLYTISVREHFRMNKAQFKAQTIARENYLVWAKRRKHYIIPQEIVVKGNAAVDNGLRQHHYWITLFSTCFANGDNVFWGETSYGKSLLIKEMLEKLNTFQGIKAKHNFPFTLDNDWPDRIIKANKIPRKCLHVCDKMIKGKLCGDKDICNCPKCYRISEIYGNNL